MVLGVSFPSKKPWGIIPEMDQPDSGAANNVLLALPVRMATRVLPAR